jgi:hypothetical protein
MATNVKTNSTKPVVTVSSAASPASDVCVCQHGGDQHGTTGTCRFAVKAAPNGCGCVGFRAIDQ